MQEERNALDYTVKELIAILEQKGGSSANFSFKNGNGELIAVVAIATMDDAYRLKNICKEYLSED